MFHVSVEYSVCTYWVCCMKQCYELMLHSKSLYTGLKMSCNVWILLQSLCIPAVVNHEKLHVAQWTCSITHPRACSVGVQHCYTIIVTNSVAACLTEIRTQLQLGVQHLNIQELHGIVVYSCSWLTYRVYIEVTVTLLYNHVHNIRYTLGYKCFVLGFQFPCVYCFTG